MLKLENVSKFYYNKGIIASGFNKINLELKIGEFVVITGESGSGKSTLLNVISGLDSYEEGEMYINGKETSHYSEEDFEDYRRKYIANIFQNFNLVNSYTVYQNIELVLLLNGHKKKEIKDKVLDIIDKVGLKEFKNTKVSKLSGGQKQRVAIARAMVKETPIIVADEPTGNLDSKSAYEVIELLKNVAKDRLVIVVTHNIEQVEGLATRIIKMHDGRIVENRKIKDIEAKKEIQTNKYNNITLFNKYRLGIRNTFNIKSKFLLLFAVFIFISMAILSEYASFQMSEDEALDEGYSYMFEDLSANRVLINKNDRSQFTEEDYKKIESISNIDYIIKDDVFIDNNVVITKENMQFYGYLKSKNRLLDEIDLGRMPENDNEIVLELEKDYYYIEEEMGMILDETFSLWSSELISYTDSSGYYTDDGKIKLKVVGIKFYDDNYNYECNIYVSDSILDEFRSHVNKNYSTTKLFMNNEYQNYVIESSDKVEKGKAIVDDELKYSYKNNKILNTKIEITASNIYYEDKLELKISDTYTKSNFKKLIGSGRYDSSRYIVYINTDDYNSLFDKDSYQSSVYVKNVDEIEQTINDLETIGIHAKKVTDFKINEGEIYQRIIKIVKLVVTIGLVVALFFISYMVIRIILKSRNVYYSTLRMLGATYNNTKRILQIELFTNSTIAYFILLTFVGIIKKEIINMAYINKLLTFIGFKEYLLVYIILIAMARLISNRFAKKIFKNTAIKTYNEEV